jgi:hypothetical protein
MKLLTGTVLFSIAGATALTVMLPMAIYGGVVNVESNPFIAWGEFALCMGGSALGMINVLSAIEGGKEK